MLETVLWVSVYGVLGIAGLLMGARAWSYRRRVKALTGGDPAIDFDISMEMIETQPEDMAERLRGKVAAIYIKKPSHGRPECYLLDANAQEHYLDEIEADAIWRKAEWLAALFDVEVHQAASELPPDAQGNPRMNIIDGLNS